MHIRLLAIGTQGDVQPYVALGLGLQRAGFEVSLGTTANFKAFVERWGLSCVTSDMDLQAVVAQARQRCAPRKAKWAVFRMLLDDTLRLSEGADALLYSPTASLSAPHVAEKLKIPAFPALLQPFMNPTRDFPAVMMPALRLGGWYNRLTYTLFEQFTSTFLKRAINTWRRDVLDLPPSSEAGTFAPLRKQRVPTLYGVSPIVLPKPAEWGEHVHMTGYWFLPPDAGWQPPRDLVAFLEAGPPPVYIGFGSMGSHDPRRTAETILGAIKQAGVRGIIASGWEGISTSDLPDSVRLIDAVPHDWLFPRMAAVVHHGGAGTTAAGLRAGVPTVIVPFGGDQPFWGRHAYALGVGPEPIPRKRLTADRLANALRTAVENASLQQRAAAIGQALRAEDGVGNAVRVIEAAVSGRDASIARPVYA